MKEQVEFKVTFTIPPHVLDLIPRDGKWHRVTYSTEDGWRVDDVLVSDVIAEVKGFPRALTFDEVVKLYEGHKPFHCKRCDLWFMTRSELMKHIWDAHRRPKDRR